ncbi:MAG: DsbC family protein [Formivibrio sp.]|nr:DsbC family protein [Formivibrio sp.]
MHFKKITQTFLAAGLIGLTACSASADNSTKQLADVKARVTKQLPGKEITSVNVTPMKGIFEVVMAGNMIVYTDAKADYLIFGDMVDVAKRASLTEARLAELRKVDFAKLPFDTAIKEVRGDGSRKLAVFSDPDCPFCKQLERQSLKDMTNITIYTFLMPLTQLHPDAARKARIIWCAQDRAAAWKEWIINEKLPANSKEDCDNPVASTVQLGAKLGINGTPGLIFPSGRMVPGAIAQADIEKLLLEKAK